MANFFVIRANSEKMKNLTIELEMTIRGHNGVKAQIDAVAELIARGFYKMVPSIKENMETAEEIFDAMNMSEDYYMTVSDVIVWCNGKRELVLKEGWATI